MHRKSNEFDPVTLNFKVYIILKLNELQISDMHTKNNSGCKTKEHYGFKWRYKHSFKELQPWF